jgi:hypothetical protein
MIKKHGLSLVIRLAMALTSILSGVFGYIWAIKNSPNALGPYIHATLAALIVQTLVFSVAARGKNRFLRQSLRGHYDVRTAYALSFVLCFTFACCLCVGVGAAFGYEMLFGWYFILSLICVVLQLVTFPASTRQQVLDIDRFFLIQISSSSTRLGVNLLCVFFFKVGFMGLLMANIAGAAATVVLYKAHSWYFRDPLHLIFKRAYEALQLLKWDGFVRAARPLYEQYAILSTAAIMGDFAALTPDVRYIVHASTGFLSAVSTVARQVFSKYELGVFNGTVSIRQRVAMFSLCGFGVLCSFPLGAYSLAHGWVLSHFEGWKWLTLIKVLDFYIFFFPFSAGFMFIDYFGRNIMRAFSIKLVCVSVVLLVSLFVASILIPEFDTYLRLYPIWGGLPVIAVALSMPKMPRRVATAHHSPVTHLVTHIESRQS